MITSRPYGTLPTGETVTCYRLPGGDGAFAEILDYGGTIRSVAVPDREGFPVEVTLGRPDLDAYRTLGGCLGATVGRHANRIGGAAFTLNGVTYPLAANNGPNHLHGGPVGFNRRLFRGEIQGDSLRLHLTSPHMDQGFPGELRLTVTFTFSEDNALTIRYQAETDRDTVVNLTNHSYFDLSGGKDPMGQLLRIDAEQFTENDENTLPTGRILPVAGTAFDFREEKPVGRDLGRDEVQLRNCGGYDHNFVLKTGGALRDFAWLSSPVTGITMTAATDLPGVQLYSANALSGPDRQGRDYARRAGVCLETQFFPNAMAVEAFEKPILRAGQRFEHVTVYRFGSR